MCSVLRTWLWLWLRVRVGVGVANVADALSGLLNAGATERRSRQAVGAVGVIVGVGVGVGRSGRCIWVSEILVPSICGPHALQHIRNNCRLASKLFQRCM